MSGHPLVLPPQDGLRRALSTAPKPAKVGNKSMRYTSASLRPAKLARAFRQNACSDKPNSHGAPTFEWSWDQGGAELDRVLWPVVLAAFLAFRVFDIVKPWPANRLEHVPGGWGVMADDVMAGVYANLLVQGLVWARPGLLT